MGLRRECKWGLARTALHDDLPAVIGYSSLAPWVYRFSGSTSRPGRSFAGTDVRFG